VRELVAALAASLDRKDRAESWLARFPAQAAATQGEKKRVLIFDCCAPPFTAGKRALVSDLLTYAGAENVFADVEDTWFHTSWEAAVARKPDVILIDDYGPKGGLEQKRQMVSEIAPLKGLPIVVVPLRDMLGTIRTPEVLKQLQKQLSRSKG
jgi:iron complex transport system substrate-binding protein